MEKLRKALEKVKQEQVEEKREIPGATVKEPAPPVSTIDKIGRVSPVYSQSQPFEIDPATLIENRLMCISSDSFEIEFYKILRTQILQRTGPNGWNTIMITSALP